MSNTVENVYIKYDGGVFVWHREAESQWYEVAQGSLRIEADQAKIHADAGQDIKVSWGQEPALKSLPVMVEVSQFVEMTFRYTIPTTSQQVSTNGWISTGYVSTEGDKGEGGIEEQADDPFPGRGRGHGGFAEHPGRPHGTATRGRTTT